MFKLIHFHAILPDKIVKAEIEMRPPSLRDEQVILGFDLDRGGNTMGRQAVQGGSAEPDIVFTIIITFVNTPPT